MAHQLLQLLHLQSDLWLINVCSEHTISYSLSLLHLLHHLLFLHFACFFVCLSRTLATEDGTEVRHCLSRRKVHLQQPFAEHLPAFALCVYFHCHHRFSFFFSSFANSLIINLFIYRFADSRSNVSLSLWYSCSSRMRRRCVLANSTAPSHKVVFPCTHRESVS